NKGKKKIEASYMHHISNENKNCNQDLAVMRKSTIDLIRFLKGYDAKNKSIENGGEINKSIIPSRKLTRYETFFNYVFEHNNDKYLPTNKDIYNNLKYEGKNFTEFLVNVEKKYGKEIGDFEVDKKVKRYKLVRKNKY
ncbi:MAG: hypothetical protein ABF289_06120, partial [Clostridiales bacterium]